MIVKKLKCRSNSGRPHPRPLSRLRKRGVASLVLVLLAATAPAVRAAEPIDIGSRRELFVDRFLIQRLTGTTLELHRPTYAGIVLRRQFPWEGTFAFGYITVIKDGDRYRMYYRTYPGGETADGGTKEMTCYAESTDGIHWIRPELGLFRRPRNEEEQRGAGGDGPLHPQLHPVARRPPRRAGAGALQGAGGISPDGLVAFVSPDGLHWKKLREKPVLKYEGWAFDSQNVAFWSASEKCYVCYFRIVPEGVRAIARATSADFVHWSAPVAMKYGELGHKAARAPVHQSNATVLPHRTFTSARLPASCRAAAPCRPRKRRRRGSAAR